MIGNSKGILVCPQWLEQSSNAGRALPIDSFRLLNGGSGDTLQGVSVGITSVALNLSSCPPHHDLQLVVSSAGGTLLASVDAPVADGHTNRLVVTSCDTPRFREKISIEGITSDVPITIISLARLFDVFKTQRSPIVSSQEASGFSSEVYSSVAVRADASPPTADTSSTSTDANAEATMQPVESTVARSNFAPHRVSFSPRSSSNNPTVLDVSNEEMDIDKDDSTGGALMEDSSPSQEVGSFVLSADTSLNHLY